RDIVGAPTGTDGGRGGAMVTGPVTGRRHRSLGRVRTMEYDLDLVVIGGGPAGERGAAAAGQWDKRVVLVDRGNEPGGACVHTGTLPSKTLREVALTLAGFGARRLAGLEVRVDRATAVPKLMSRKDEVRES